MPSESSAKGGNTENKFLHLLLTRDHKEKYVGQISPILVVCLCFSGELYNSRQQDSVTNPSGHRNFVHGFGGYKTWKGSKCTLLQYNNRR